MLTKAHAHAGADLEFKKDAIEAWQPHEKFDLIFSNAVLQWCENQSSIFGNLKNYLNASGGQLAIQMPMNFDYPTHVLADQMSCESHWNTILGGKSQQKKTSMLKPEEYARILYRLGFKKQKVLQKVYGHELSSREAVIDWVKGTLLTYFESRMSTGDYSRFLSEYRTRLFRELPDEKPFFYPFKRILIWRQLT